MGKVEDMRALKQQLREGLARTAADLPTVTTASQLKRGKGVQGTKPKVVIPDEAAGFDLCGHRNIGNKSCTRPAGHAEKNHRYGKTAG